VGSETQTWDTLPGSRASPQGTKPVNGPNRPGAYLANDLNGYYVSRLTQQERAALQTLEGKSSYLSTDEKAVQFSIGHLFERQSVLDERKLYEVAIRHGIGSVTPESVIEEAHRQGVLLKDGQATTKNVLAEESRIIEFAREGKGTMRPLGVEKLRPVREVPELNRQAILTEGVGRSINSHPTGQSDPAFLRNTTAAKTDTATSTALGQQKTPPRRIEAACTQCWRTRARC
jgi:hypothetical protein